MSGPARGRLGRVVSLRAALACLVLIGFDRTLVGAQTLTPDLFRPTRDGFVAPQDSPLRRTAGTMDDKTSDAVNDARLREKDRDTPAKSRIGGQIPTYGLPAASGASSSGYDSLNRTRKRTQKCIRRAPTQTPRRVPAVARRWFQTARCGCRFRPPSPPTSRRCRRRWPAPWAGRRRASGGGAT